MYFVFWLVMWSCRNLWLQLFNHVTCLIGVVKLVSMASSRTNDQMYNFAIFSFYWEVLTYYMFCCQKKKPTICFAYFQDTLEVTCKPCVKKLPWCLLENSVQIYSRSRLIRLLISYLAIINMFHQVTMILDVCLFI